MNARPDDPRTEQPGESKLVPHEWLPPGQLNPAALPDDHEEDEPMNAQPANPWHDATVEPTGFPILTITRSGQLDVMHHYWDKSWRVVFEYHDVVRWQTIELPHDVFGNAVKDGVTLT